MYLLKEFEFEASEIAKIVSGKLIGEDIVVNSIKSLGEQETGSITVCYPKFKDKLVSITEKCLVFCTADTVVENSKLSFIVCENPKFSFFDFVNNYVVTETNYSNFEIVSKVSDNFPAVEFGYNVKINKNVVIAPKTKIGSNVIIGNNVVIRSNVTIGNNVIIKDNTIIGSEGFGFVKSENEVIHIPQLGEIRIDDNVIIGSCCTIEKPALGSTIIEHSVKIDDLVQIGHNQVIGEGTMITTGFKAIGGAKIGKNCFIGMGVTVVNKKANIGDNCFIGAGTILTKSVENNSTVYNKIETIFTPNTHLDEMLTTPKKIK
ncbi:DapH/DapD/GlmU-related protein [Candidatus Marinarcus aquaticus]|uniref:UDP-3-O-(3-hydroxymyristoyl)glucosamine N-acyltransferase n=1 Tax=Candidatus Marinarcus aquaticus TaxID=2044504 RepID=A0A4V1LNN0_9BACT|nr:DapH/DapD/GlmU-related protein [Candidatus Marinarcus aquaticus]RXJ54426.1 hypothetical protein CRV04_11575 [Candidatus Marinarcus aquaticus]